MEVSGARTRRKVRDGPGLVALGGRIPEANRVG